MFSSLRKQLGRISIRLTLWHAFLFLVAALGVLSVTYLVIQKRLNLQERDVIELRLNQYASEYERGGMGAVHRLAALRKGREQKAFFVRIADAHNRTIFLRDSDDWAEFNPSQLAESAPPREAQRTWITLQSPTGTTLLLGTIWLSDGSLLEVGRSTQSLQDLLTGFRTATLVVLLIFLPISVIGGAFLASQMLHPLHHLTAVAERIVATGSFDARVPSRGNGDELDALVQVFNEMLSRIERLIRAMRESLDNVAHDLRTPITRIRQKAQVALAREEDAENARDALADCVEETEHVTTLLNTLMDISEAESGAVQFQHRPVAIRDLIASATDSYLEVAEEKGVTVKVSVPPGWKVDGDVGSLRRVFANLLDNAIKYTPRDGNIHITAERIGGNFSVQISDTGQGISPEDLPRIWDRLFRGDKSRSERGLGLGLSFVRAIVNSHGGSASVQSGLGVGTRVTIVLPAAKAPLLDATAPQKQPDL
ncbi:HAMP domain-containing sensor histidine kinase [soil metagenome]